MTSPAPNPPLPHTPGLPVSALIVDDDPFMLDYLSEMLGEIGVPDVRRARGGDELDRVFEPQPDAVICDLNMPGKDGFLVMADLAERRYKGRVLLVSGMDARTLNSASLMARFHRLNVVAALAKPVERKALAAALRKG